MIPAGRPAQHQRLTIGCRACVVVTSLAAEAVAGHWRPLLGAALAVADVVVVAAIIFALLISILCGSTETYERAFRLRRWASGRAEPPAPPPARPGGMPVSDRLPCGRNP